MRPGSRILDPTAKQAKCSEYIKYFYYYFSTQAIALADTMNEDRFLRRTYLQRLYSTLLKYLAALDTSERARGRLKEAGQK